MNKKNYISEMTFGAMMLAIFVICHFIFPVSNRGIQSIMGIVTSIPIAVYSYLCSSKKRLYILLAGVFLSFLFFELILTISFIIPNLIFGILLGVVIRKSNLVQLMLIIIACILFNVYEIYINCLITGIDIIKINITSIN